MEEEVIGILVENKSKGKFSNKEVFRQGLEQYYGEDGFKEILKVNPCLDINLKPCGGEVTYNTWEDIPEESVPCPCGNPKHWLIKYEKEN